MSHSADNTSLEPALRALAQGLLIAYPTETFFGLGADPRSRPAVDALLAHKGRFAKAGIPLVLDDARRLSELLAAGEARQRSVCDRLQAAFWPGPLTLVFQPRSELNDELAPGIAAADGSLAVRVSSHPLARKLAAGCRGLLTSTSANPAGEPPSVDADMVRRYFPGIVLVEGNCGAGGAPDRPEPSTIVDIRSGQPRLLRAGAVPAEAIERCLAQSLS